MDMLALETRKYLKLFVFTGDWTQRMDHRLPIDRTPITFITTSIYQVANFVNYGAVLQIAVEDFVHDRFGVQRHL